MTIKILSCFHKEGYYPKSVNFLPIQVGSSIAGIDLGIQKDSVGDNISDKNPNYCELTALYWAWKNLKDVDYVGFCHYRRYFNFHARFSKKTLKLEFDPNLVEEQIAVDSRFIEKYDIVLPSQSKSMTSMRVNYCYAHIKEDFDILEEVIKEKYPSYYSTFLKVADKQRHFSFFNMFIAKDEIFCEYCEWLFGILFEVEKRIKYSPYPYQQRVFGFMGERLLNVFISHKRYKVGFRPVVFYQNL